MQRAAPSSGSFLLMYFYDYDQSSDVSEKLRDRNSQDAKTEQVTEQVRVLVVTLGDSQVSVKELMERIGLKHRPNFLENYLGSAILHGFVTPLHPDISRHPRQKYLLTVKGLLFLNSSIK